MQQTAVQFGWILNFFDVRVVFMYPPTNNAEVARFGYQWFCKLIKQEMECVEDTIMVAYTNTHIHNTHVPSSSSIVTSTEEGESIVIVEIEVDPMATVNIWSPSRILSSKIVRLTQSCPAALNVNVVARLKSTNRSVEQQ